MMYWKEQYLSLTPKGVTFSIYLSSSWQMLVNALLKNVFHKTHYSRFNFKTYLYVYCILNAIKQCPKPKMSGIILTSLDWTKIKPFFSRIIIYLLAQFLEVDAM